MPNKLYANTRQLVVVVGDHLKWRTSLHQNRTFLIIIMSWMNKQSAESLIGLCLWLREHMQLLEIYMDTEDGLIVSGMVQTMCCF